MLPKCANLHIAANIPAVGVSNAASGDAFLLLEGSHPAITPCLSLCHDKSSLKICFGFLCYVRIINLSFDGKNDHKGKIEAPILSSISHVCRRLILTNADAQQSSVQATLAAI